MNAQIVMGHDRKKNKGYQTFISHLVADNAKKGKKKDKRNLFSHRFRSIDRLCTRVYMQNGLNPFPS